MSLFRELGRKVGRGSHTTGQWIKALTGSGKERAEAEALIGRWMVKRWMQQLPTSRDAGLQERLQGIAHRLGDKLKRYPHPVQVWLIAEVDPYAVALPGGHLLITEGLVESVGGEPDNVDDRLAFLLAHELAHDVRGHVRKRLLKSAGGRVARTGLTALQRHLAVRAAAMAANKALSRFSDSFDSGVYGEAAELEADTFARSLCRAAGYDPAQGPAVLMHWQQTHNRERPLPEWIMAHPPLAKRLRQED